MKRHIRSWLVPLGLAVAVAGCATTALPPEEPPPVERAEPAPPEPPPADVTDLLVPSLSSVGASVPGRSAEPRFDVSVEQASLREFLGSLVEGTPYDIVVHPDVAGVVSLSLRRVTVPEVLDAVREIAPIDFRLRGRVFVVRAATLQARTFHVDYLNLQRGGRSETRVSSGEVSSAPQRPTGDSGLGPVVTDGNRESSVVGSHVSTNSAVDFWREIRETVTAIVGSGPERSVVVSPHSGLVVVRADPEEMRAVERYLGEVQLRVGKEVILEAKILEIALSDRFQSGINWAAIGETVIASQTGGGTLLKDALSEIAGNIGNLNPSLGSLPSGTDTSAFGGAFSLAIDTDDFTAFVELLETQGDVHTLSNPRIATVSNQKAVIKVGSDEFFVTDVSSTTVTGTATTTTPDITLTPFFSGIALDVTPQIGVDDEVTLHIHPSVSEVQDQTKEITVGGETQRLPLAFSTIRESDSVVRAKSGQIVVIGGLIEDGSRNDRAGLPWLGDVPWLGALFRQTGTEARRRELVILLKPLVVGGGTWDRELTAAEDRVQDLKPDAARLLRENPSGPLQRPEPW